MAEGTPPPTAEHLRDRLAGKLTGTEEWKNTKKVGPEELVVFHPTGKKFSVTVKEIEG